MGFSGGGTGSFVLPDHTHTNAIANGGALVGATSLVDAAVMDTYVYGELAPGTSQADEVTTNQVFSGTNGVLEDVTDMTLTMPTNANKAIVTFIVKWTGASIGTPLLLAIVDDGTAGTTISTTLAVAGQAIISTISKVVENDGQIVKLQAARENSINVTINSQSNCHSMELK
jgi:hypothetical protein